MSERVKLADAGLITSLSDTDNMLLESGGSMRRAALSTFTDKVMGDMNVDMMVGDVKILYRNTSYSGYRTMASLAEWPSLQSAGQYAIGVALLLHGKTLVVSVEAAAQLLIADGSITTGRLFATLKEAVEDQDGEGATAAILAASTSSVPTDTAQQAAGYCNLYSRINSNGRGINAGHWWLPSLGELLDIFAHYDAINYALSLIDGASPLAATAHWSSTQYAIYSNYVLRFSDGYLGSQSFLEANREYAVRPVTVLQDD